MQHGNPTEIAQEQERHIRENLKAVKHRIVVFSGKGGVGKTTVSVNLACALSEQGCRVGLLDADVTGPDVPKMIGLRGGRVVGEAGRLVPSEQHGLKVISLAMLTPAGSPIVWRGPLRSRALDQFLGDVAWGELDYLVADLPPGTGDEVLTMAQRMEPQLALIVTTPQEMSLIDSRRAINMAKEMKVAKIGVVENMSALRCPACSHRIELFGSGGGERVARELGIPFLGRVPMNPTACEMADQGRPIVLGDDRTDVSRALLRIAEAVRRLVEAGPLELASGNDPQPSATI
jgi:Mrp family chromosome partitioning ATPase